MVKKNQKGFTIGCDKWDRKPVSKPLISIIMKIQNEEKKRCKQMKGKKKKQSPSFVGATMELSRRIKKNGFL